MSQAAKLPPPLLSDKGLSDFSQVVQGNLLALFQAAHVHAVISVPPTERAGAVGDIYIFDDGTNIFLYIKTSRGWARSSSFTLI